MYLDGKIWDYESPLKNCYQIGVERNSSLEISNPVSFTPVFNTPVYNIYFITIPIYQGRLAQSVSSVG